ncbi:MAG: ral nucleoside transport system permease protein [Thermoleophilaceae bacterium]|jgi:simple sugar transport system permease protein|nr:ral nucleoside transport system permease protein [Thermoleophilaceae bacterium]
MSVFFSSLDIAVQAGVVIILAGMGELLLERTGVMNLGIEGMISIGAVAAVLMATVSSEPVVCLLVAVGAGMAVGAVFALFAVVLRVNQVLAGLAIFLLCIGLTNELGADYSNVPVKATFDDLALPGLSSIPEIGPALFDQPILVYVAYVVLPCVVWLVLFRSRHGLNVRAVGENPAAADAAGISVMRIRTAYCLVAGGLAAAAGAYLMLSLTPSFSLNPAGGRGWVALAAVIFAAWLPWRLVAAGLLFGGLTSLGLTAQAQGWNIPTVIFAVLPYVVTIALMFLIALRLRLQRLELREVAPAALATPYYREER